MRTAVLFLALLISTPALGQVYSWRDADGEMHYADQAPPGAADLHQLEIDQPSPGVTERARRALASREAAFNLHQRQAAETAAKAAQEKIDAEDRRKNCEKAQSYVRALKSGLRIERTGKDGERVFLDDRERQGEQRSAQRAVDAYCR